MKYLPFEYEQYNPYPGRDTAFSSFLGDEHKVQLMNFMWLSLENLDAIPELGSTVLVKDPSFRVHRDFYQSLYNDVIEDDQLYRRLTTKPSAFLAWFKKQDHSAFYTYECHGDKWVSNVIAKCEEAIARLEPEYKPIQRVDNVVYVDFRRAVA